MAKVERGSERAQPFDAVRVTTEALPDGRAIHYYESPADRPPEPGPDEAAAGLPEPQRDAGV